MVVALVHFGGQCVDVGLRGQRSGREQKKQYNRSQVPAVWGARCHPERSARLLNCRAAQVCGPVCIVVNFAGFIGVEPALPGGTHLIGNGGNGV